jgi:hypothetical protein
MYERIYEFCVIAFYTDLLLLYKLASSTVSLSLIQQKINNIKMLYFIP